MTTTAFLRASNDYQTDRVLRIDGARVRVARARGAFAEQIAGILFVDIETGGLIRVVDEAITRHPMPEGFVTDDTVFLWDSAEGQALALTNTCQSRTKDPSCRWKALWLSLDLEPLATFEMPGTSLIEIKGGYTCFSCGCGCYSHQDFYVQNGAVYAHVWGYPVTGAARGIYRYEASDDAWRKLASGHTTRPLAISPDGKRAAVLGLSYFGDALRVIDLP